MFDDSGIESALVTHELYQVWFFTPMDEGLSPGWVAGRFSKRASSERFLRFIVLHRISSGGNIDAVAPDTGPLLYRLAESLLIVEIAEDDNETIDSTSVSVSASALGSGLMVLDSGRGGKTWSFNTCSTIPALKGFSSDVIW